MINSLKFEWYYFDMHTDDGFDLVVTIHPRPFNSVFNIFLLDIFLYKEQHVVFHHFIPINYDAVKHKNDTLNINFGKIGFFKEENNSRYIKIADKYLQLDLQISLSQRYYNPETIQLMENPGEFEWIVYYPMATAKAVINWKNYEYNLQGRAYHDYNCGTVNLKNQIKKWFWGKFYLKNSLMIIGAVESVSGYKKQILMNATNDTVRFNLCKIKKTDSIIKVEDTADKTFYNFEIQNRLMVDEVNFYMSRLSKKWINIAKFLEILHFAGTQNKYLFFLNSFLANCNYSRHKGHALIENEKAFFFFENMNFEN